MICATGTPVPGITAQTSFTYKGKTYTNELDVIRAYLADVLGNTGVAQNVMSNYGSVLVACKRLAEIDQGE